MEIRDIIIQMLINKYKEHDITVDIAKKIKKEATEIIKNDRKNKPQNTFIEPRI